MNSAIFTYRFGQCCENQVWTQSRVSQDPYRRGQHLPACHNPSGQSPVFLRGDVAFHKDCLDLPWTRNVSQQKKQSLNLVLRPSSTFPSKKIENHHSFESSQVYLVRFTDSNFTTERRIQPFWHNKDNRAKVHHAQLRLNAVLHWNATLLDVFPSKTWAVGESCGVCRSKNEVSVSRKNKDSVCRVLCRGICFITRHMAAPAGVLILLL